MLYEVITKLKAAQRAVEVSDIFAPNVEALEKVQPVDLLPSEISVRLGATWIPEADRITSYNVCYTKLLRLNTPAVSVISIIIYSDIFKIESFFNYFISIYS